MPKTRERLLPQEVHEDEPDSKNCEKNEDAITDTSSPSLPMGREIVDGVEEDDVF
jgi:hypothetical protein